MKKFLFLLTVIFMVCGAAQAQNATKAFNGEPFAVNESLTYEIKVNWGIFKGLNIGEMRFKVNKLPETDNSINKDSTAQNFIFHGEVLSKGSLAKIARQKYSLTMDSTVSADAFRIIRTVKHDQQNERVRDSITNYDYKSGKLMFTETNPQNLNEQPRVLTAPVSGATHDLMSAIYSLRRVPLTVGKEMTLSIADNGVVYETPVKVLGREMLSTKLGKVWTYRIQTDIFGSRRVIETEGTMTLWITDDARRLPVRARVVTDNFKAEIRLDQWSGLRNP